MAPLHNPAALKGIKAFKTSIPNALMVACFDTAFHQTMNEQTYLYPVPYEWYVKYDVRKYGFHGLSHKFITDRLTKILGINPNLIICHIGSGASITAVREGICIDTSMGFTPNAGIMMGTRSGDIDYSIIKHVMNKAGKDIEWIDQQLNRYSGLQGIAGMNDLRDIDRAISAKDKKVLLAVNMYTDKIVDYIAKYYVKLGGKVDAICFTAGGGENDNIIRAEVLKKLYPLGIIIDEEKNNTTIVRKGIEGIITKNESKIPVYVLATDEELMIARDAYNLSKDR
jgi:acetate kinase